MKRTIVAISAVIAALALAGCGSYGESHNHNAPAPNFDIHAQWVRIQTPGNYHTIIRACVGKDGVYIDQSDNNSVTVTTNDPDCDGSKYGIPAS